MGILIADDSPDVHFQLKVFLHASGYQKLTFAKSASEAYTVLEIDSPESNQRRFDLNLNGYYDAGYRWDCGVPPHKEM